MFSLRTRWLLHASRCAGPEDSERATTRFASRAIYRLERCRSVNINVLFRQHKESEIYWPNCRVKKSKSEKYIYILEYCRNREFKVKVVPLNPRNKSMERSFTYLLKIVRGWKKWLKILIIFIIGINDVANESFDIPFFFFFYVIRILLCDRKNENLNSYRENLFTSGIKHSRETFSRCTRLGKRKDIETDADW